MRKLTTEQFIEKARKVHGDTYDYSLVEYINRRTKVNIVCKIHDVFEQIAGGHLGGNGCPKCAGKNKTTKSVIKEFKELHGDKYDYSETIYINDSTKVKIKCRIHGNFNQTPNSHLQGSGCIKCGMESTIKYNKENPQGWTVSNWEKSALKSKNFDSFKVYIIRCWNGSEGFYKIGRTYTSTKKRFKTKILMPYNFEILKEFIFNNSIDAFNKEKELKRINKKYKYVPLIHFCGKHECFSEHPELE